MIAFDKDAASADRRLRIRNGLDIAIGGEPDQSRIERRPVSAVGLVGPDYPGLRLVATVGEGDPVLHGQTVAHDRSCPTIRLASPGSGVVTAIRRGRRREVLAIELRLEGDRAAALAVPAGTPSAEQVRKTLLDSGLWSAFRQRPFPRVPDPELRPHAVFVTAIDTEPLAPDPHVVIGEAASEFSEGLARITALHGGDVYLCIAKGASIPGGDLERVHVAEFSGPHPAGLPGTHMHLLAPVGRHRVCWHVGYQDVIAIGRLFATGSLPSERVVALAGPQVARPRLLRARMGADLAELVHGELLAGASRVIAGSVLDGRQASEWGRFLGRYHRQVSVLADELSQPRPREPVATTAMHGHPTLHVPSEIFERVMPLDLLPSPLLRALLAGDIETAEQLGCLELDAEDLALCTYVCPGKMEYGPALTSVLDKIAEPS